MPKPEPSHQDQKFDDFSERLKQLSEDQRLRQLVPRQNDGVYLIDSAGQKLLNFGANDYLGIATETRSAAVSAGSGASALVCGWTPEHEKLASIIADFESTESAVVFPSGYAACSSTIAALAEKDDLILSDELNHASLIDGCRLSRAKCHVYPHRGLAAVEEQLTSQRKNFHRVWIVTDGVFSMDGHVAPLVGLCELAEQYDANLIVDEAHGTGVLGETGSGVCEALGVKDQVAIRIGTLSKAIGAQGGFVAGPKVVIDYLVNHCRSLIFSTSLSPAAVSAATQAFELVRSEPKRRTHVCKLAQQFRSQFPSNESLLPLETSIPIIPVITGADARTIAISRSLAERGFYVPAIRPPTVPEGKSRLRVSLSAAHQPQAIDALAEAINELLVSS